MEPIIVKLGFSLPPNSSIEILDLDLHIMNDSGINLDWHNKVLLNTISTISKETKFIKDFPRSISKETIEEIKKRIPILQNVKYLGPKIMLYREKKGEIPEMMKVDKDIHDEDELLKTNTMDIINLDSKSFKDTKLNDQNTTLPTTSLQTPGIYAGLEKDQGKELVKQSRTSSTIIDSSSNGKVCNTISWSKRSYFQRVIKSGLEKFIPNTLGGSQWMLDMDFFDIESDCMSESVLEFGSC
jgi:hypothetical protein